MSGLYGFLRALGADPILDKEVRAEAWALGGRHRGQVLEGARAELSAGGLSPRRQTLLRAVIRSREMARP